MSKKIFKQHRKYELAGIGVMYYSDELLCEHGVGHEKGVHGCDGCCSKPEFEKEWNSLQQEKEGKK